MSRLAPLSGSDEARHRREIAFTANEGVLGRTLNTGGATLAAGATSTIISDPRLGSGRVILLVPLSREAATLSWWQEEMTDGKARIGHDAPAADAAFAWIVFGTGSTRQGG